MLWIVNFLAVNVEQSTSEARSFRIADMIRLTRAQVREVDRRAINDYGIPGIVLMENAARGAADVAMNMIENVTSPTVAILCGGGNNGGDGLAIARHLHNRGVAVTIIPTWRDEPTGDAAINLDIVQAMKLPTEHPHDIQLTRFALNIDALFGTGLKRPIAGDEGLLIEAANQSGVPILAIDVPSGMDCDIGTPLGKACIRARRTVTFVAEKAGFANPQSKEWTGDITVAEIGAPPEILAAVVRESQTN